MPLPAGCYAIPHSQFLFPISPYAPWSAGRMTFEAAGTEMCTTLIRILSPSVSSHRATVDENCPRLPCSSAYEAVAVGPVPYPASPFRTIDSDRLDLFPNRLLPSGSGVPDLTSTPTAPGALRGPVLWLPESSTLLACLSNVLSPFRSVE